MRIKFLKLRNWLFAALGGLVGINLFGCRGPFVCEYGTPEAEYRVRGCVTDEEGKPIEDITVKLAYSSGTTNIEGDYDISYSSFPDPEDVEIFFKDEHRDEDDSFNDTSFIISFKDVPMEGGDGRWDEGVATVQKDVTLHRRNKN